MKNYKKMRDYVLQNFTEHKKEAIEDAVSDVVLDILQGNIEEHQFFTSVKYKLLNDFKIRNFQIEGFKIPCDRDDYQDFEDHDFFVKNKKQLEYHLDNDLAPKQRQAIIDNINGKNNYSDGNYKYGLKTLRTLMDGNLIRGVKSKIKNIRKPKGTNIPGDKLNLAFVSDIRRSTLPAAFLAEKYGLTEGAIRKIKNRERYKYVEA